MAAIGLIQCLCKLFAGYQLNTAGRTNHSGVFVTSLLADWSIRLQRAADPMAAALERLKMSRTSYLCSFWWAGSFLRTCGSSRGRTQTQTRPDMKTNKPPPSGSRPKSSSGFHTFINHFPFCLLLFWTIRRRVLQYNSTQVNSNTPQTKHHTLSLHSFTL